MLTTYTFRLVFNSLYKEKWINLLSALTIATGLFLMAAAVFLVYNLEIATRGLPERFSMTVFLNDDLTGDKINGIVKTIKQHKSVRNLRYISKDDALGELKALIKDANYILEGLDGNPLPASLEVGLKREAVGEASVKALAQEFKKVEGVAEVDYGEKFLSSIQSIKASAEGIGILIIAALGIGIVFVCYSTIKILFYRKKDEVETLQLLGASKGFIRAPFIIEAGIIGMIAGLFSLAGIILFKYLMIFKLTAYVPMLRSLVVPVEVFLYLPLTGILIGMVGAVIAIGRIRF